MPTTTTTVGRLQLDHPDLNHDGGVNLHTKVRTAWTQIADNINSRFFTTENLTATSSVNFIHNFKADISEVIGKLYLYNSGTGELTRLVSGGFPNLDHFVITPTVGSETTSLTLQNNSGQTYSLALIVTLGREVEKLNDLEDVDTVTSAPQNGNALVWDGSNFIPDQVIGVVPEASPTVTGTVNQVAQSFAGEKTFNEKVNAVSGIDIANGNNLNVYISSSYSTTFTYSNGGTTNSMPMIILRLGRVVIIQSISLVEGTPSSDSNSMISNSQLPPEYHPKSFVYGMCRAAVGGSALVPPAYFTILTNGNILFTRTLNGASPPWTGGSNCAVYQFHTTYISLQV